MTPTKCKLTPAQIRILHVLNKARAPVERSEVLRRAGASNAVEVLGYASAWVPTDGQQTADSLLGLRYVREVELDIDGKVERAYELTGEGRSAAEAYLAVKRRKADERVEVELLDEQVLRMKPTRSYGLERWTDEDMRELRDRLGDGYEDISLTDLRVQVTNRRKQGAYADPNKREITSLQKLLREFGPDGTMITDLLTEEQVTKVKRRLAKLGR